MKSIHNIKIPLSSNKLIQQIKRKNDKPISHGNKIWNSSLTMIDFLSRYNLNNIKTAIDVGCGWGLVVAYLQQQGLDACGIDIDQNTEPYVNVVNKLNKTDADVIYIDYMDLPKKAFDPVDLVIGCDICYWENHVDNIIDLIKKANCTVLIADPGRDTFWKLTKKIKGNLHDITLTKPRAVHGYVFEVLP